ncbi:MAG: hypothetical protein Q4E60_10285, partial [Bacteroidales bacterium]|nr:hypothetical protein [Bacteroidales bacterium]
WIQYVDYLVCHSFYLNSTFLAEPCGDDASGFSHEQFPIYALSHIVSFISRRGASSISPRRGKGCGFSVMGCRF